MTTRLRGVWPRTKPLASYEDSFDNNFNLMRLIAAAMVILGHSYFLTAQHGQREPLLELIGIDSGTLAVDVFFVISGFLVAKSYLRNGRALSYVSARFLRIFPGLMAAVVFNVFVVGAIFTDLPLLAYLSQPEPWKYLLTNATLLSRLVQLEYYLPGVFTDNPVSQAINGSLWTLPYEVWLYVGLLVGGTLGVFKKHQATNILFMGLLVVNAVLASSLVHNPYSMLENFLRFSTFFGWGVAFLVNSSRIPVSGMLAIGLIAFAAIGWNSPVSRSLLFPLALAYNIFWLAYIPGGWVRMYNRLGDYSYGTYIYAFPIQQSILAMMPNTRPLLLLGITLPITLGIAALSWHLVEQPALRAKQRMRAVTMPSEGKKTIDLPGPRKVT